ncbi:MAG: hypothetical protein NC930_03690 [Candidatus Omnitrophica bacterium]|nr:hypothetical protein [Candidatus Omnitrophota bacterium]
MISMAPKFRSDESHATLGNETRAKKPEKTADFHERSEGPIVFPAAQDFRHWLLRSGISPDANLTMNRIGIYTDFN